jgi:hypothetical protein
MPPADTGRRETPHSGHAVASAQDTADFDRYLRWLQFVEHERSRMRAQGETQTFSVMSTFSDTIVRGQSPRAASAARRAEQGLQGRVAQAARAVGLFRQNIVRTKPPVTSDCKPLDAYYTRAVMLEAETTAALLGAVARRDLGRMRTLARSGAAEIDRNLGMANKCLENVLRERGLAQQFRIQSGSSSSLLGGVR